MNAEAERDQHLATRSEKPLHMADQGAISHKVDAAELRMLVDRFIRTCGTEATKKTYVGVLRDFAPHFAIRNEISNLGVCLRLSAEDYVAELRNRLAKRIQAEATVKRKICALSSFLEFCNDEGFISGNPLKRIDRPTVRPDTRAERALSLDERDRLISHLRAEKNAELNPAKRLKLWRLELVVRLCLTCGCRIGEVLKVRRQDIEILDANKARIHLLAKGSTAHSPMIPSGLANELLELAEMQRFRKKSESDNDHSLFFPKISEKAAEKNLNSALISLAVRAGIQKHVTVHTLRATCATLLHDQGVPVVKIQKLLGHKSISTTSMYIRSAEELCLDDL